MRPKQRSEVTISTQNVDVNRMFLLNAKPEIVIEFLRASHWRYEHELIPRIEQEFLALINHLPNVPSLPVIFNLFLKFQLEMKTHMEIEEQKVYPAFLSNPISPKLWSEDADSHEDHEPFLHEIIRLIEHSSYSNNPFCRILLSRLHQFEAEQREHAWIEENVIFIGHS